MIATLCRRPFALLWFGELISLAGYCALIVALQFHVYELRGSIGALAAMFIISSIPQVLPRSVAGVFMQLWIDPSYFSDT